MSTFAIAVILLTYSSGCTTIIGNNQRVFLEARAVDDVPDGATVASSDDERIRDVEPIQKALKKAGNDSDGVESVELSRSENRTVQKALDSLPYYDGTDGLNGYYVRMGNQTYVLNYLELD
jgi:hypothetical protein